MDTLTLIINPSKDERKKLIHSLQLYLDTTIEEFQSDAEAMVWLKKNAKRIDYIFTPWEISQEKKGFLSKIRLTPQTKDSMLFLVTSEEDLAWVQPVARLVGSYDDVLTNHPGGEAELLKTIRGLVNPNPMSRPYVLLVDDDVEVRGVVKDFLLEYGFSKVFEVSNGAEAALTLEQDPGDFSLIVSDWQMPMMNGIELLKKVRTLPELARTPFIMITAKSPEEQLKTMKAAELGVNGYLQKPFTLLSFKAQLATVLKEISNLREIEAYIVTGRALLAQGRNFEAEKIFAEATQKFPNDPNLWESYGDVYAARMSDAKGLPPAAEAYEKALQNNPFSIALFMKCFEIYTTLGKMNDAIRLLKTQASRAKHDDMFRTRLGKIYLQNGHAELAAEEFERALATNPKNEEAAKHFEEVSKILKRNQKAS